MDDVKDSVISYQRGSVVQSPVPVPLADHIARRVTITLVLLAVAVVVDRPFAAAHGQTPAGTQAPARVPDIFFAPTLYSVADDMLKLARVTAQDVVYDLGSGDGRILMIAAQKYGARGVGVEIDH